MEQVVTGAIAMGWAIAGLYFARFWRASRDRFFLWFALSFWLEAANRVALGLSSRADEHDPIFYGVRLLSYGLVILAIWQKNPRRRGGRQPQA